MSIDVVYEKVVSAEIKNDNSPSGFPEILKVCRLGETQHLFFCNSLFIFIIKWQN